MAGPPDLPVYARYAHDTESLLAAGRYWAIKLQLDTVRLTHISTEFEIGQETATPAAKGNGFLIQDKWIKSASNFKGTLVDRVLQPGIRLGNALSLTLPKIAAHAQEQAPGEKTDVERDAQVE